MSNCSMPVREVSEVFVVAQPETDVTAASTKTSQRRLRQCIGSFACGCMKRACVQASARLPACACSHNCPTGKFCQSTIGVSSDGLECGGSTYQQVRGLGSTGDGFA